MGYHYSGTTHFSDYFFKFGSVPILQCSVHFLLLFIHTPLPSQIWHPLGRLCVSRRLRLMSMWKRRWGCEPCGASWRPAFFWHIIWGYWGIFHRLLVFHFFLELFLGVAVVHLLRLSKNTAFCCVCRTPFALYQNICFFTPLRPWSSSLHCSLFTMDEWLHKVIQVVLAWQLCVNSRHEFVPKHPVLVLSVLLIVVEYVVCHIFV